MTAKRLNRKTACAGWGKASDDIRETEDIAYMDTDLVRMESIRIPNMVTFDHG